MFRARDHEKTESPETDCESCTNISLKKQKRPSSIDYQDDSNSPAKPKPKKKLAIHYPDSNNQSRDQSVEKGSYPLRVSPIDFDSINSTEKEIREAKNSGRMTFLFTETGKTQGGSNNGSDANCAIYDYREKCPNYQSSLAKYGGNIMACPGKPPQQPCGGHTNESDKTNRSVDSSKLPPQSPFLSEGNNKGQNNSGHRIGVVRNNGKGSTFSKNPNTANHYMIHDACKTTGSKTNPHYTKTCPNICPNMNQEEMLQIIENSPPMRKAKRCID
jgi:hypothetical protein